MGLWQGFIGSDAPIAIPDSSSELNLGGGEGSKDSTLGAKPVGKGTTITNTAGVVDGSF
jgi:hypothetical protein